MRQSGFDLSQYEIDGNPNPFGNGGFGTNYKAEDKRKQKKVVIKKIKSDFINQEKNWIHREIAKESTFHHETILELSGYILPIENQGDYSIITPLMPNGDLNNLIKQVSIGNKPDDWETIKSINIIGIAAGMAYLHHHNFIHQDLKPEHIVLDENNFPKIIVFHCSKLYKGDKKNLPIEMTIYMALELLNDDNYTNKIDVFSYGMLLYSLLTLQVPWSHVKEISSNDIYKLVSEGKRPELANKEIPNCYKELIEKCWSNDPEDRPSFDQIVKMMTENKDDFFDMNLVDEEQLDQYIELVTLHL